MQGAAFQKDKRAYALAIVYTKFLYIKDNTCFLVIKHELLHKNRRQKRAGLEKTRGIKGNVPLPKDAKPAERKEPLGWK